MPTNKLSSAAGLLQVVDALAGVFHCRVEALLTDPIFVRQPARARCGAEPLARERFLARVACSLSLLQLRVSRFEFATPRFIARGALLDALIDAFFLCRREDCSAGFG